MNPLPRWLEEGARRFGARRYFPQERQIHVTELLNPPHLVRLKDRHHEQLQTKPLDLIPAMLGVAWHEWVEGLDDLGESEHTHRAAIAGWTIIGTPDWYSPKHGVLRDYKTTRMWSHVFGRREWEEQLNVYRWLLKISAGLDMVKAEIHAIFTDWSLNQVKRNPDLPQQRLEVYDVPLWNLADTERFIKRRLYALEAWDDICTVEERWERGEHWAVMRKGRVRAVKRCQSLGEAEELVREGPDDLFVEHRPGVPARCLDYCPVKEFCSFGRNLGEDPESVG